MFHLCPCISEHSVSVINIVGNESNSVHCSQARVATPIAFAEAYNRKTPWWYRLFGRLLTTVDNSKNEKQSSPRSNGKAKKKGKPKWWERKKKCRVSSLNPEKNPKQNKVFECQNEEGEKTNVSSIPQVQPENQGEIRPPSNKARRLKQISCLGFPNPAQICYMNSCLQSLLTLEDFIGDIIQQEQILRLSPDAAILRSLIDIQRSHFSEALVKVRLLSVLKKAVARNDPEFTNLDQKDAHEFLTSMLNQIRGLTFDLQVLGLSVDRIYSCPVEKNFVFKMHNIRRCKSCGTVSIREEDYTNLSLDLICGCGTVQEMLENCLREKELEYKCQCGATKSGQHSSFVNLPRVLVLHLKRFSFTSDFQLMKNHDSVVLSRELVVPSNLGGGCYSLVSTINHIGNTAKSGHYICDAVDPDVGPTDVIDRWFTYSDDFVTETNGASVCHRRENTSYVLFYKRQD